MRGASFWISMLALNRVSKSFDWTWLASRNAIVSVWVFSSSLIYSSDISITFLTGALDLFDFFMGFCSGFISSKSSSKSKSDSKLESKSEWGKNWGTVIVLPLATNRANCCFAKASFLSASLKSSWVILSTADGFFSDFSDRLNSSLVATLFMLSPTIYS